MDNKTLLELIKLNKESQTNNSEAIKCVLQAIEKILPIVTEQGERISQLEDNLNG